MSLIFQTYIYNIRIYNKQQLPYIIQKIQNNKLSYKYQIKTNMRKLRQQQDSCQGSSNLLNYKERIIEPVNYRQRVKNRFMQEVNQIVNKNALGELVIVLDSVSAFLLSNIFTVSELVSMKILYIEKFEVKRKKLDKHALYFISPTKNNIQILNKDFPMRIQKEQVNTKQQKSEQTKDKKQKKQKQKQKEKQKENKNVNKQKQTLPTIQQNEQIPQYRRIHILFTTFLDKGLLKLIAVNKVLLKRIAKNSLKQFYFSARVMAPNLIDMNMPYLALAYSKQSEQQVIRREYMCRKIIQFIANYTKISTIRIFYKKSANKVCDKVALTLEKVVKNYLGILLDNRSPYICKQAADITILLMDRSVDTVTPFIHYYTFQALLFDFFNVSMVKKSQLEDKGAYSYQEIQNQVYDQYRYKHITQALQNLPEALQSTKGKLQSLKSNGVQTINIKELTDQLGYIKSNLQKLQSIWKQFETRKIAELGELQQSLGTGITDANVNTSSVKLVADVQNIIKDPNTPPQQRLRLAILCLSCIRMCKEDYQSLLDLFNAEDKKILRNMIALGVSYDGSQSKSTKTITKDQQKLAGQRMQKSGIPLDRYTSIVQLVIPLFCKILQDPFHSNTIDKEIFGQIECSIFNDQKKQQRKFNKQSFAMCMIGGMSWSQVSAIRNVPELRNIVLMADSVMTAPQLLKQIGKINIISQ